MTQVTTAGHVPSVAFTLRVPAFLKLTARMSMPFSILPSR